MKPPDVQSQPSTLMRTYKYRLYPSRAQIATLEEQLAFACDLYNSALEQRRAWWQRRQPWWLRVKEKPPEYWEWLGTKPTLYGQMRDLTDLRATGGYPDGMNLEAQRDPLRRLDRAFETFFRRCKSGASPGYPRFRSRRRYDSQTWPIGHGAAIDADSRVRLQAVGGVKVKWHRLIPKGAVVKTATVRRSCGRWYVCFSLELASPSLSAHEGPDVGLDLGVACFARLSTGEALAGPRAGRSARRKVRRLQRRVARCQRRSGRRRKAVGLLAHAKEHEANVRRNHRHRLAYELARRFSVIYVEDLRIGNMTRSAKGSLEEPGHNVRQKAGLNREILDQAWGDFLAVLESEAEEAGSRVVKVVAAYTSQKCAKCGVIDARSRRSQAEFVCVTCGHAEHADTNASQVVLGLGRSLRAETWGQWPERCPRSPTWESSRGGTSIGPTRST